MSDLDTLADTLDEWVASTEVSVTETNTRLRVNQLSGAQALQLVELIDRIGWPGREVSDRGGDIPRHLLTDAAMGVTLTVDKPAAPPEVEFILTRTAFSAALARDNLPARLWVHGLPSAFSTSAIRISPWGDAVVDAPIPAPSDPRRVVRFLKPPTVAQRDLGRWMLRDLDAKPPSGKVFEVWCRQAAAAVSCGLANEIDVDGVLLFRGPPVSRFRAEQRADLEPAAFEALQRAAAWVYGSPRELENRQGLLAAEVARSALRDGDLCDLADVSGPALEGARIAYGFGVAQQSKDTLKALSDLRKAVMDETAKLGEATRALATAVSGALFGAIGLVVARLTLAPSNKLVPMAAVIIAIVLAAYVGAVIASGLHYLRLQRRLRTEWRPRLYNFLTQPDYKALVTDPVAEAERGYIGAAWIGGGLTALLVVAAVVIVLTPLPPGPAQPANPGIVSAPAPAQPPVLAASPPKTEAVGERPAAIASTPAQAGGTAAQTGSTKPYSSDQAF